jgi:hypothetical protein
MRGLSILSAAVLVSLLGGCSGDPEPSESPTPTSGGTGNAYTDRYGCVTPQTGYRGDDTCLSPPDPEDGFQLHYGPTDYSAAQLRDFEIGPGGETVDCVFLTTPNDREVFWQDYHVRARPGTHHIIVYRGGIASSSPPGTHGPCDLDPEMTFLVGAQSGLGEKGVVLDVPLPGGETAPENRNVGYRLPPNTRIAFQTHYVNSSQREPLLREAWVNFHYKDPSLVEIEADPIFFLGGVGMRVKPHSREIITAGKGGNCVIPPEGPDELRILGMTAHVHSHTVRFSAYKTNLQGKRELIYQTFDWQESLNVQWDSSMTYEPPDPVKKNEGALSGVQYIKKGEAIDWECEIENDDNFELTFGNKAYEQEMCNLFGYYTPSMSAQPWRCLNL